MRKNENRLSFEVYTKLYGICLVLFSSLFCERFAFYTVRGSRLLWYLLNAALSGGIFFLMTIRFERKISSLLACTVFPSLFYEIQTLSGMYTISKVRNMTLLAALVGGMTWATVEAWIHRGDRRYWLRKAVLWTVILWTTLLLPACIKAHNYAIEGISGGLAEHLTASQDAAEEDLTETLLQLNSEDWTTHSEKEKLHVLAALLSAECRHLGITDVPDFMAARLQEGVLGHYLLSYNAIRISRQVLQNCDGWESATVLLHEVRHAYQAKLQAAYKSLPDEYRSLALFNEAGSYEFDTYVRPEESYAAYKEQLVEQDAEAYAAERIALYKQSIMSR